MGDINNWANTGAGNDKGAPPDFPIEFYSFPSINNTAREGMAVVRRWHEDAEWVWGFPNDDGTVTILSGTQFRLSGDQSVAYVVGRRVRAVGPVTGTIYGGISIVTGGGGNTDVTVVWDSGSLAVEAVAVHVGAGDSGSSSAGRRTMVGSGATSC